MRYFFRLFLSLLIFPLKPESLSLLPFNQLFVFKRVQSINIGFILSKLICKYFQ